MARTSKKKTTRKTSRSAGSARNAAKKKTKTYNVGDTVSISEEEARKIRDAEAQALRLQQAHHALRKEFLQKESELLALEAKCQTTIRECVKAAAESHDIPTSEDSGQNWRFAMDQMQFTRVS